MTDTDLDMTHHSDPPPPVQALIARARTLTGDELTALAAAWAATQPAMAAARDAEAAAWAAAWSAAFALALRGELDEDTYRTLTGPWALVVGRVHPDDTVD